MLGALGGVAEAKSGWWGHPKRNGGDSPQTILNIAATAEVLATIVNTIGYQKVSLDAVTKRNVGAAAREELIHYNVLTSLGAKPLTKKIWVPDAVFKDASGPAQHAAGRRSDLRQRLPHRDQALRSAPQARLRRDRGGVHGRRGRAPRTRPPVARAARQRSRVHEVRAEGDGTGRPQHRDAGLRPHRRCGGAAPGRRLRLRRQGRARRARSTTSTRSARRPPTTPTSTRSPPPRASTPRMRRRRASARRRPRRAGMRIQLAAQRGGAGNPV